MYIKHPRIPPFLFDRQKNDFEFAFKVEKDYVSVYEALYAMTEEDKWMIRNRVS